ncbi:DUF987 family protein, partial [Escherichia coli]
MRILTSREAIRIHEQHPASRLFPFSTGKYPRNCSTYCYT